MTQLKIMIITTIIIMMIMISTIFQNNTKKLEKMTYFIFTSFGGVMFARGLICHPQVRKSVIKYNRS